MSDTPLRHCSRCETDKPDAEFSVRLRDADGTPHRWYSQCRECRRYSWRPKHERTPRDYVPVGPFRMWINERKEHYGGIERLAIACGKTSARQLRRVLRETNQVSIYVVDEWVTPEGSTRLDDLYPLNEDAEQVAA